jgi:hypothetical protein
MTDSQPRSGQSYPTEGDLLAAIGQFVKEVDPPPGDLVQRIQFALELEQLDVEVARWERADALAGVRGSDQGTITFTVNDLTVMINLTRTGDSHRIDGWLVPAGDHTVEVRVAEHGSSRTTADEGGRFVLDKVPRGTTQILVHLVGTKPRTVATPTVVL